MIPGEDICEGDEVEVQVYRELCGWVWRPGVVTERRRGLTPIAEYAWKVRFTEYGREATGYFYARTIRKAAE